MIFRMTLHRLILLVFVVVTTTSCAALIGSDDFSVSGTTVQAISIEDNQLVTIRCFCPNISVKRDTIENILSLKITGTHGSGGYHGDQVKPESISENLLRFVEKLNTSELILESHEYTYIHHAFIIHMLEISAPSNAEIRIEVISDEDLHDRTVD